jgi:hypothetical protein
VPGIWLEIIVDEEGYEILDLYKSGKNVKIQK